MEQNINFDLSQWSRKKHIFFGLDGTLLNGNFDKLFWGEIVPTSYSKVRSLNIEQSKSLLQAYLNDVANMTELYSIDYWEKKLGINILDLKQKYSYLIKLNEHVEKLLFYIFSLNPKPKCHIISNAHPTILDYKVRFLGLDHFFDSITSSLSLNMLKQDRNFWPCYLEQLGVDSNAAILFDSSFHTVDVATDVGLASVMLLATEHASPDVNTKKSIKYIKNFQAIMPDKLTNCDVIPNLDGSIK